MGTLTFYCVTGPGRLGEVDSVGREPSKFGQVEGDGIDVPDETIGDGGAGSARDDALEEARAALERTERTLADVSAAMSRLDDGTYLNCEACGAPIGDDRLDAQPLTRRCANCAGAGPAGGAGGGGQDEGG